MYERARLTAYTAEKYIYAKRKINGLAASYTANCIFVFTIANNNIHKIHVTDSESTRYI